MVGYILTEWLRNFDIQSDYKISVLCFSVHHKTKFQVLFSGHMLDVLARTALWDAGLDYLHGTGHGVGAFLNVHEGVLQLLLIRKDCFSFASFIHLSIAGPGSTVGCVSKLGCY